MYIETTITGTDNSVPQKIFFLSIPLYALRRISGDDFEKFPIADSGVDTEHLLQFAGFLRILSGTKLISYSAASIKPPYGRHQLHQYTHQLKTGADKECYGEFPSFHCNNQMRKKIRKAARIYQLVTDSSSEMRNRLGTLLETSSSYTPTMPINEKTRIATQIS